MGTFFTRDDDVLLPVGCGLAGGLVFLILVVGISGAVENKRIDAQQRADSTVLVERMREAENPQDRANNALYRTRFLALFDLEDRKHVGRGFAFASGGAARVYPEKRMRKLGMSRYDLDALRAGKRPVTAREMISICQYYNIALADFLNPAYPLDPSEHRDLEGLSVSDWLRENRPVAHVPHNPADNELLSAAEWLAQAR